MGWRQAFVAVGLLCASFVATSAEPPAPLQRLASTVSSAVAVALPFTQTQLLPGMAKPLHAAGEIAVSASGGLVWAMTEPFPSAQYLPLEGPAIDQFGERLPHHPLVTEILVALFRFDLPTLQRHFTVEHSEVNGMWRLELKPSSPWLANEIAAIQLQGQQQLQNVQISYPSGSVADMAFQPPLVLTSAQWQKRLAQFP